MGVRDIVLKMTLGMNSNTKKLYLFPDLKRMFISVVKLVNEGHHVNLCD